MPISSRTPSGPTVAALEVAAQTHRANLLFTRSLVQNPIGYFTDLPTAHAVLQSAERFDMQVVDQARVALSNREVLVTADVTC